jgi:hypothetical protein
MREKLMGYFRSAFSEPNGTGSSTRLLAGGGVLSAIVWVSYIVFKTKALPDLTSASLWLGASFSGYGMGKISDAFQRKDSVTTTAIVAVPIASEKPLDK